MNILLINHYAGSLQHGMEYRPYYFAREWVRLGHRVTIVAASESHVRSRQPITKGAVTEEWIDGIRYIWLRTPCYRGNGISRVYNIFSFVGRLLMQCARLSRELAPDVVIASSTYPLDIYPAYSIASASKARLIFEVHDLWPLSPMELGGMSKWHPFIMAMQRGENRAYRVADRVVSMLPKAKEHMVDHGMSPGKFVYVPNGIVVDEWNSAAMPVPVELQTRLEVLKQHGRFLIGYAGGHGLSNALDQLLMAAELLLDSPVTFVLVGQGAEKKSLQQRASHAGLTNVDFIDSVPKESIPALLRHFEVLYLGWKKNPLYRFGICPNKLMDYMMAGKPIIHAVDAGNDVVAESGCGLSVPPEDHAAIAEAVNRLMTMTAEERFTMGRKGKEYVLARHDIRNLAKQFIDAVESA